MEDWALIRRLAAEGMPKARIAARLGISRNTVAKAIVSDGPPKYERKPRPTSFTPVEARVRQLLADTPDMPATVVAERVGWTGSIRWFRDNVNQLRVEQRPVDPADRLVWAPGDAAQCDLWFPPRKILLEDGSRTLLPVLVLTAAHSRFTVARMIPTRVVLLRPRDQRPAATDLGAFVTPPSEHALSHHSSVRPSGVLRRKHYRLPFRAVCTVWMVGPPA
ncbi:helix-turn-helix domain-containing protein [Tessaracoccus sp. Y1736]